MLPGIYLRPTMTVHILLYVSLVSTPNKTKRHVLAAQLTLTKHAVREKAHIIVRPRGLSLEGRDCGISGDTGVNRL